MNTSQLVRNSLNRTVKTFHLSFQIAHVYFLHCLIWAFIFWVMARCQIVEGGRIILRRAVRFALLTTLLVIILHPYLVVYFKDYLEERRKRPRSILFF